MRNRSLGISTSENPAHSVDSRSSSSTYCSLRLRVPCAGSVEESLDAPRTDRRYEQHVLILVNVSLDWVSLDGAYLITVFVHVRGRLTQSFRT